MIGYFGGNITINSNNLQRMTLNKLSNMFISQNTCRVPCGPKIKKIDWEFLDIQVFIKEIQIFEIFNPSEGHPDSKHRFHFHLTESIVNINSEMWIPLLKLINIEI